MPISSLTACAGLHPHTSLCIRAYKYTNGCWYSLRVNRAICRAKIHTKSANHSLHGLRGVFRSRIPVCYLCAANGITNDYDRAWAVSGDAHDGRRTAVRRLKRWSSYSSLVVPGPLLDRAHRLVRYLHPIRILARREFRSV